MLQRHVAYVYAGLAILVCFYFLSGPTQGLRSFLTTLIVAGMAAFGIHELRKQTQEEYPDANYGDAFGRTRDKVVSAVRDANIGERVGEQASKLRLPEVKRPGRRRGPHGRGPDRGAAGERGGRPARAAGAAGLAARQGHPHRRGVRRREGAPAGRRWQRHLSLKPAAGFEPATS